MGRWDTPASDRGYQAPQAAPGTPAAADQPNPWELIPGASRFAEPRSPEQAWLRMRDSGTHRPGPWSQLPGDLEDAFRRLPSRPWREVSGLTFSGDGSRVRVRAGAVWTEWELSHSARDGHRVRLCRCSFPARSGESEDWVSQEGRRGGTNA